MVYTMCQSWGGPVRDALWNLQGRTQLGWSLSHFLCSQHFWHSFCFPRTAFHPPSIPAPELLVMLVAILISDNFFKKIYFYLEDNCFTILCSAQFSSVAQSCLTLRPLESQPARSPCPSLTPGVHADSHPLSQWCHQAISSSIVPFSSCPQCLPASETFPMSQLFTWGGQSTGVSALASFLPKNTQDWSPLGWTGWISLQSKGLSRVFSNTTVQKRQFFSTQLSL